MQLRERIYLLIPLALLAVSLTQPAFLVEPFNGTTTFSGASALLSSPLVLVFSGLPALLQLFTHPQDSLDVLLSPIFLASVANPMLIMAWLAIVNGHSKSGFALAVASTALASSAPQMVGTAQPVHNEGMAHQIYAVGIGFYFWIAAHVSVAVIAMMQKLSVSAPNEPVTNPTETQAVIRTSNFFFARHIRETWHDQKFFADERSSESFKLWKK